MARCWFAGLDLRPAEPIQEEGECGASAPLRDAREKVEARSQSCRAVGEIRHDEHRAGPWWVPGWFAPSSVQQNKTTARITTANDRAAEPVLRALLSPLCFHK